MHSESLFFDDPKVHATLDSHGGPPRPTDGGRDFQESTTTKLMQFFGELTWSSLDSLESESDSNKSEDDRLNSPKSCGVAVSFVRSNIDSTEEIDRSIELHPVWTD